MFFKTEIRLRSLEQWRRKMDAEVTKLTANIAELQSDVTGILAELKDIQAQLAAGIDAADEAAVAAANVALADVNSRLAAVLPAPPGTTGTS